jgi:DNA-binding NarL/FixJ family response regulator
MEPLRLLIVADNPLARAGLATLLSDTPDCLVIGQLSSPEAIESELEAEFSVYQPDVIIWDLGWDVAGVLPQWQEIDTPIVALLADEAETAEAWAAGVQALLRREIEADELLLAAQTVAAGLVVFDPGLAQTLLPAPGLDEMAPAEALTPRESEVLQLLAEGVTNKAIAQELTISEHTVKFHVNAIMGKLGAQSRTEAVVRATRLGLILL